MEYKLELVGHTSKPLERQSWEGCEIHGDQSDIIMNSKLDHYAPAVGRMVMERGVADRGRGARRRGN